MKVTKVIRNKDDADSITIWFTKGNKKGKVTYVLFSEKSYGIEEVKYDYSDDEEYDKVLCFIDKWVEKHIEAYKIIKCDGKEL